MHCIIYKIFKILVYIMTIAIGKEIVRLLNKLDHEHALAVKQEKKSKLQKSEHNNCMHLQFQSQWSGRGYQDCFCNILRELER